MAGRSKPQLPTPATAPHRLIPVLFPPALYPAACGPHSGLLSRQAQVDRRALTAGAWNTISPQVFAWLTPSLRSGFSSNFTSTEKFPDHLTQRASPHHTLFRYPVYFLSCTHNGRSNWLTCFLPMPPTGLPLDRLSWLSSSPPHPWHQGWCSTHFLNE